LNALPDRKTETVELQALTQLAGLTLLSAVITLDPIIIRELSQVLILKIIDRQSGESYEAQFTKTAIMDGQSLIGRHPSCNLVLNSPEVSRVHGRLVYQAGQYHYSDLGSTGGSAINNEPVQTNQNCLLQMGDIIRIGRYSLLVKALELSQHQPLTIPELSQTQLIPVGERSVELEKELEASTDINSAAQADQEAQAPMDPKPIVQQSFQPVIQFGQSQLLTLQAEELVFTAKVLKEKGILKSDASALVYQGKPMTQGMSLAARFRQRAIDLCQTELDRGRFCLIVEYPQHFTLWHEVLKN
jgi:predicted component of type VI protein secretion system